MIKMINDAGITADAELVRRVHNKVKGTLFCSLHISAWVSICKFFHLSVKDLPLFHKLMTITSSLCLSSFAFFKLTFIL